MQMISVNRYRIAQGALEEALAVLQNGGVVAHPTESSYGLAVDPTNSGAVTRLFRLKRREKDRSVLLVAASLKQAQEYVDLPPSLLQLARKHWPAPLTLIGQPRRSLAVRPGKSGTVAVRVPSSIWPRTLAAELGHPVTSTSANLSGHPSAYSAAAVRRSFASSPAKPDLVLDAGLLPNRPPSTVVCDSGSGPEVLRQGPVRID